MYTQLRPQIFYAVARQTFPIYPIVVPHTAAVATRISMIPSLPAELSSSLNSKIQPPHISQGLDEQEIRIFMHFIEKHRKEWKALNPGDVLRYDKTVYKIPRTLEVIKGPGDKLRIMILCKTKVSVKLANLINYTIQKHPDRLIGNGSYKIIIYALDWDENKLYANLAMHFLPPELIESPLLVAKLKNGIEIANKLAGKRGFSSSTFGLHEYFKTNSAGENVLNLSFFMPYSAYGDLWKYCTGFSNAHKDIPMESKDRLNYFLDIASGLKSMNELRIVHHDINPHNYIFERDENGKFHLVCIDFDFSYDTSKENRFDLGTHAYESPERIFKYRTESKPNRSNIGIPNHSHDVWSAGLSYLFLLAANNVSLLSPLFDFINRRKNELKGLADILIFTQKRESYLASINKESETMLEAFKSVFKDAFELGLIRQMLEADPDKRIDAEQLCEILTEKLAEGEFN